MNKQPQDPTLLNTDIRYRNHTEEISNQDKQQIPNQTTNVHPLPTPPPQEQTFSSTKPTDTRKIPDANPTIPPTTMITPITPPPMPAPPPPPRRKSTPPITNTPTKPMTQQITVHQSCEHQKIPRCTGRWSSMPQQE